MAVSAAGAREPPPEGFGAWEHPPKLLLTLLQHLCCPGVLGLERMGPVLALSVGAPLLYYMLQRDELVSYQKMPDDRSGSGLDLIVESKWVSTYLFYAF